MDDNKYTNLLQKKIKAKDKPGDVLRKEVKLIDKEIKHTNGEYYVTLVYNLLIQDDLDVKIYDTDFVTVFGTPSELENYKAWHVICQGEQVKNKKDLINCYEYWNEYFSRGK